MTNRRLALAALLALLVGVPLAYAGWNELQLHRGRHVLLRVEPFDPNDPFRGNYVQVSYAVSRVSTTDIPSGVTAYVPLRRRADGTWTAVTATTRRPTGGVFLRGRVLWVTTNGAFVDYGSKRYYVQEGTAGRYEAAIARRGLYADVVVDSDGTSRIAKLVTR